MAPPSIQGRSPSASLTRDENSLIHALQASTEDDQEIAKYDAILASVTLRKSPISSNSPRLNLTPTTNYSGITKEIVDKMNEVTLAKVEQRIKEKETKENQSPAQSPSPPKPLSLIGTPQNQIGSFETPKAIRPPRLRRELPVVQEEISPASSLQTSLTREKLLSNFEEALDLNIKAKQRFCKHEEAYARTIRSKKRLSIIQEAIEKLDPLQKKTMDNVRTFLKNYSDDNINLVVRRIQDLQHEARQFLEKTNANREKRRPMLYKAKSPLPALTPYAAVSPRACRNEYFKKHGVIQSPSGEFVSSKSSDFLGKEDIFDFNVPATFSPILNSPVRSDHASIILSDKSIASPELNWPNVNEVITEITGETQKSTSELSTSFELPSSVPEVSTVSSTTTAIEFDEKPLFKDAEEAKGLIHIACKEIWLDVRKYYYGRHDGMFEVIFEPDLDSECLSAYRQSIADTVCYETENLLQQGFKCSTFEEFCKKVTAICFNKLGIDCTNDLLREKHVWTQKDKAFAKIVTVTDEHDQDKKDLERTEEYKRGLLSKAIGYEAVLKYDQNQGYKLADITYNEVQEFLKEHASNECQY